MTTTVAMSDVVAALEQLGASIDYDEVGTSLSDRAGWAAHQ